MIKPILFNAEMVRAILDGRKTCTRRLVRKNIEDKYFDYQEWVSAVMFQGGKRWSEKEFYEQYPPYQVGDILYVRETWQHLCELDGNEIPIEGTERYYYAATDTLPEAVYIDQQGRTHDHIPWEPSIHMPKEAARIWLKVTAIWAERLHDITGKDVLREGIYSHVHPYADYFEGNQREMFAKLWDSTIKKSDIDRYGWEANPWVWVIEFEQCEKPKEIN